MRISGWVRRAKAGAAEKRERNAKDAKEKRAKDAKEKTPCRWGHGVAVGVGLRVRR